MANLAGIFTGYVGSAYQLVFDLRHFGELATWASPQLARETPSLDNSQTVREFTTHHSMW